MPTSSSQINPRVVRVCHANTRWAAPLKTISQPTKIVTPIPAAAGTTIANTPAKIIKTLRAIDQPTDCLAIVPKDGVPTDVVPIDVSPVFEQTLFEDLMARVN